MNYKRYFLTSESVTEGHPAVSYTHLAVNKYIIEKEYNEFISLLRMYINSKKSNIKKLFLSKEQSAFDVLCFFWNI